MRQKTLLSLTIHNTFTEEFIGFLGPSSFKLMQEPWPDNAAVVPQPGAEDDEDEDLPDLPESRNISLDLYKGTTVEKLAKSYELEGQGQQRFWIKQDSSNSCFASIKNVAGHSPCRVAHKRLYC